MILRQHTRRVRVGKVDIGGGAPVSVQSMAITDTRDVEGTLVQIYQLASEGCEIVRLAVPDQEAAQALAAIKPRSPIPVVADIHFDYRLALAALEAGVDKLRINPGNIGSRERTRVVAKAAKARRWKRSRLDLKFSRVLACAHAGCSWWPVRRAGGPKLTSSPSPRRWSGVWPGSTRP